jgi:ribose/xylose/arabinose/galactoside ABC-type transport system permease subunit
MRRAAAIGRALPDPQRFGGIYVWIVLIVVFSILAPETFPTADNLKTILNQQAVTALLAIGLVVPLAAGVYDLSIVYAMNLAAIFVAWLLVNTGLPLGIACVGAVLAALLCGVVNGIVVVRFKVDSFIGTLATGSVFIAVIALITKQLDISIPEAHIQAFQELTRTSIGGITLPVFYVLILALLVWYLLEYTPTGRYLYATGSGREAAELAGIPTGRLRVIALLISAGIGGIAGVVVTSRIGIGSTSVGPGYLLPVFAAVFLGATQIRAGRFNVWGALIGVYLLATATQGFTLMTAPVWVSELFNGLVLIIAVAIAGMQRRHRVSTD